MPISEQGDSKFVKISSYIEFKTWIEWDSMICFHINVNINIYNKREPKYNFTFIIGAFEYILGKNILMALFLNFLRDYWF